MLVFFFFFTLKIGIEIKLESNTWVLLKVIYVFNITIGNGENGVISKKLKQMQTKEK